MKFDSVILCRKVRGGS